jgi:conjugative relaxase-like TrwC/TraI family protein
VLTAQTQYSLGNARSYFAEHLAVGDYYAEGQTVAGLWFGRGCERLGLAGRVGESEFLRLCDNQHPSTAEPLTARLNTVRASDSGTTANRRIFFDFTFSPPKSVSIAALVGGDDRILAAHAQAVHSALSEFESFAATRIRVHGADTNRSTGNLVSALFTHETSRALDPHLHTHAIVFNATWDPVENRWKALQNQDLLGAKKVRRERLLP